MRIPDFVAKFLREHYPSPELGDLLRAKNSFVVKAGDWWWGLLGNDVGFIALSRGPAPQGSDEDTYAILVRRGHAPAPEDVAAFERLRPGGGRELQGVLEALSRLWDRPPAPEAAGNNSASVNAPAQPTAVPPAPPAGARAPDLGELFASLKDSELWPAALALSAAGFNVVPVDGDKRPLVSWSYEASMSLEALRRILSDKSDRFKGVAIVAGPRNPVGENRWLILIDVDRPDALENMPTLRGVVERTIAWRTGPRCPHCGSKHLEVLEPGRRWRCREYGHEFTIEDNPPRGLGAMASIDREDYEQYLKGTKRSEDVEILATNYQLVPPSLHPSGLQYEPIPNGAKEIVHIDTETLQRILGEIEGRRSGAAAPRSTGRGAAPAAGGLRRLTEEQIAHIVGLLDRIYRPGHHQMLWLYASGWLAKERVDPRDAARILARLYSEHRSEEGDPVSQRATALVYSYRKAGVDLTPYASELEEILGARVRVGVRNSTDEELSLKGISGLEGIANEVLGDALKALDLADQLRETVGGRGGGGGPPPEEGDFGRRGAFELLQEIARVKIKELFRDEEGEACAVIDEGDHLEVWPLESGEFDSKLNLWFYSEHKRGARREVRDDVVETLAAEATVGERRKLSLLCSLEENGDPEIIVDLLTPDWKGAVIRPDGITIEPLPPRFRRPPHLGPLWTPEVPFQGEPREVLLDFLRRIIPEPEDPRTYDLLAPILPALLLPIPRPILAFLGGHGSSKSFAQRMIIRALLRGQAPRPRSLDQEDMVVTARDNPVLFLDNMGSISAELARFLAVVITGERMCGRKRYTDKESACYEFKRAILLNGITPNIQSYPDVADRTIIIRLRRVLPEKRRPEGELEEELEPLLPRVFSASLEALRRALAHLRDARNDLRGSLPRMADFAVWGEAIARGLGYAPREWFNLYQEWVGEATEETIEASALGRGIMKLGEMVVVRSDLREMALERVVDAVEERGSVECLLDGKPTWAGTMRDLKKRITEVLGGAPEELEREGLPRTPQGVGKELRILQSSLQDAGIEVKFLRLGKRRTRLVVLQFSRAPGLMTGAVA
ncbi:MAG: bifunctional DNA primase/polymerase [Nitrososphaeria archaeon]